MALPNRSMLSVEEYLQLDEASYDARYEYIDGHLRMLAGGTPTHSKIAGNIVTILNNLLSEDPCSAHPSDAHVQLSASRYVYPDVIVACDEDEQEEGSMFLHPRIVVEVLSPGTEAYDRGDKFTYYRKCPSIQEYLLVNTQRPFIELFRRDSDNFWAYHAFESDDEVNLASLDIRFPVIAAYRKVKLPERE